MKLFVNILVLGVICLILVGCSGREAGEVSGSFGDAESLSSSEYYVSWLDGGTQYKVTEGKEYVKNEDGTYTLFGRTFIYMLEVESEVTDLGDTFSYVLLSNKSDVTYEEICNAQLGMNFDKEPEWVRIGWKKGGYTKNDDGTYTYHNNNYKYKKIITGKEQDSNMQSSYTILTNDENITYKEIADSEDEKKFVAISWLRYE